MTLWDRVAQWRALATERAKEYGIELPDTDYQRCAAELESDLLALREVVERVPHRYKRVKGAGFGGSTITLEECLPSCPRCALEARLGKGRENGT